MTSSWGKEMFVSENTISSVNNKVLQSTHYTAFYWHSTQPNPGPNKVQIKSSGVFQIIFFPFNSIEHILIHTLYIHFHNVSNHITLHWNHMSSDHSYSPVNQTFGLLIVYVHRDHFMYSPSQWETTLQCNIISDGWTYTCVHSKETS